MIPLINDSPPLLDNFLWTFNLVLTPQYSSTLGTPPSTKSTVFFNIVRRTKSHCWTKPLQQMWYFAYKLFWKYVQYKQSDISSTWSQILPYSLQFIIKDDFFKKYSNLWQFFHYFWNLFFCDPWKVWSPFKMFLSFSNMKLDCWPSPSSAFFCRNNSVSSFLFSNFHCNRRLATERGMFSMFFFFL